MHCAVEAEDIRLFHLLQSFSCTSQGLKWVYVASGDNLLKTRSRASTSEYKQLPINERLFQNTVNYQILSA